AAVASGPGPSRGWGLAAETLVAVGSVRAAWSGHVRVRTPPPRPDSARPGPPRPLRTMGSILSRRIAGVEDIDIQANSAYRYPPKSGERAAGRGPGGGCGARRGPGAAAARASRPEAPRALGPNPWCGAASRPHPVLSFSPPPWGGNYFAPHFFMGGEKFDTPHPEGYLFGENMDLNFLGNRPVQFPYVAPAPHEPVKTLRSLVNIRKDSLRLVRHKDDADSPREDGEKPRALYSLEFTFDADARVAVTIFCQAGEEVLNGAAVYSPRSPALQSETVHYKRGVSQQFSLPSFKLDFSEWRDDELSFDLDRGVFPVAIQAVVDEGDVVEVPGHAHVLLAAFEKVGAARARVGGAGALQGLGGCRPLWGSRLGLLGLLLPGSWVRPGPQTGPREAQGASGQAGLCFRKPGQLLRLRSHAVLACSRSLAGAQHCRGHSDHVLPPQHVDGSFSVKPLKQKQIVDRVSYLLQEIYGIENKNHQETKASAGPGRGWLVTGGRFAGHVPSSAVSGSGAGVSSATPVLWHVRPTSHCPPSDEESGDSSGECVVCLSDPRDTLILPCRHLCLCSSCADTLRYQASGCPICRLPFRALLQIRAVRKKPGALPPVSFSPVLAPSVEHEEHSGSDSVPPGYEPISLLEALNGLRAISPAIPSAPLYEEITYSGVSDGLSQASCPLAGVDRVMDSSHLKAKPRSKSPDSTLRAPSSPIHEEDEQKLSRDVQAPPPLSGAGPVLSSSPESFLTEEVGETALKQGSRAPSFENVLQDGGPELCGHGQPGPPADVYLPGWSTSVETPRSLRATSTLRPPLGSPSPDPGAAELTPL
ncbi:E3 ubiquitin-protein ligase MGRN1, partial [Galemys pyrenaicus]